MMARRAFLQWGVAVGLGIAVGPAVCCVGATMSQAEFLQKAALFRLLVDEAPIPSFDQYLVVLGGSGQQDLLLFVSALARYSCVVLRWGEPGGLGDGKAPPEFCVAYPHGCGEVIREFIRENGGLEELEGDPCDFIKLIELGSRGPLTIPMYQEAFRSTKSGKVLLGVQDWHQTDLLIREGLPSRITPDPLPAEGLVGIQL